MYKKMLGYQYCVTAGLLDVSTAADHTRHWNSPTDTFYTSHFSD